ncbi:MAG: flavodoxin family protein, partial [Ignavibacteria bacterium]|nr:flavodoxin family protein [Ignavibacteria bacterium]
NLHHTVRLKAVEEAKAEDILWCDGIAVGTPTQLGLISWKMKRFWDDMESELWGKIDGKIGCAFSSSGGWGGGGEISCLSALIMLLNYGFLVFGVTDYVEDKFTLHYGAVTAGEPRLEREINACRKLGQRLSDWVDIHSPKESFLAMEEDY